MPSDPPKLSGGSPSGIGDAAKFGVVTVSDRASAGIYDDLSGPAILQFFSEAIKTECADQTFICRLKFGRRSRSCSDHLNSAAWMPLQMACNLQSHSRRETSYRGHSEKAGVCSRAASHVVQMQRHDLH